MSNTDFTTSAPRTTRRRRSKPALAVVTPIAQPRINQPTLRLARRLLEMAEAGELHGLAVVAYKADRSYFRGVVGTANDWPESTVGILERIKDDLLTEMLFKDRS